MTLILQKLADQGEQKIKEPEMIESKPAIKPESKSKPAIEQPESKFKPKSEDFKSVIAESDLIIEGEQPIKKVAEVNQPTIKKQLKPKHEDLI